MMPAIDAITPAQGSQSQRSRRTRTWTAVAGAALVVALMLSAAAGLMWHASAAKQEQQAFRSTAASVTATLGLSLRRDADFVTTMRSLLTMRPTLTPTEFNAWYDTLQGRSRQIGGLGTAVVRRVPAASLAAFLARRDRDPAFLSLVGRVVPFQPHAATDYCVLAAGGAILTLDPTNSRTIQGDWCWSHSLIGKSQISMTRSATDSGQFIVLRTVAMGVPTMIIEGAFYERAAPTETVLERRAATSGWIMSTFDVVGLLSNAVTGTRGIGIVLYHRNPGEHWTQVASTDSNAKTRGFVRTTDVAVDGDWRVQIRGAQTVRGMSADLQGALVFIGAAGLSVLLFLLIVVLARSRDHALGMVEEKTGQLRHQALHDALTGLPNRVLALDRAEQMLARARRAQAPMAALYVDIDGFKHINDTFGHPAGDHFLRIVAERMRATIREADTAARLSGDEFLVLLDSTGLDSAPELVAERVLEVISEPCDLGPDVGRALSITASIGIAHGLAQSAEQLLADADVALYVAKASGKNHCVVFESGMQAATQDRLRLEMDLAEALDQDQLFLVYQPTFDLLSERTVGVEALLRWRHPERGIIGPDEFIPIAEESGLIVPIGRWVLERACEQAAEWRARGHAIGISVNVSGRQLDGGTLLEDVRHALTLSQLEASVLTLEITETTLIQNSFATTERLAGLKRLGVRIAIDDFGTGYSSLAYLRQFSVDALKIDRSFTSAIAGSKESQAVVQTLVRLGKTLQLETLAEGIEDREQLSALKRQHCDHGQGFLFAHPLEPEELERFLDSHGTTEALAS